MKVQISASDPFESQVRDCRWPNLQSSTATSSQTLACILGETVELLKDAELTAHPRVFPVFQIEHVVTSPGRIEP